MDPSHAILIVCLFATSADVRYSGGAGTAEDPYQLATAADLIALGETPGDYDRHFILVADIDLDPNLPGRKVFDRAVIAPDTKLSTLYFEGTPFTGVFDGRGHTVANLTIGGEQYLGLFGWTGSSAQIRHVFLESVVVEGTGFFVGGLVGRNEHGQVLASHSSGRMHGDSCVGGLVGCNEYGSIVACRSHGSVSGSGWGVGGLVGTNYRDIANTCSTGSVRGTASGVGGLVGDNEGSITASFATGPVSGQYYIGGLAGDNEGCIVASYSRGPASGKHFYVGGLVGENQGSIDSCYSGGRVDGTSILGGLVGTLGYGGSVSRSFWNIETSGQTASSGGTGLTTVQMQTARTFLDMGWDFAGGGDKGTEPIWVIAEGRDYPRLVWEYRPCGPVLDDGPVVFADANLQAIVEERLCICDPTATDMLNLIHLSHNGRLCSDRVITSLAGLEHAVNLQTLCLPFHSCESLWPLSGMANLKHLDLRECPVRDLAPLSVMRRLSWLNLHKTQVFDISPLTELTSLSYLDLRGAPLDLDAYEVHMPRLRAEHPDITILCDPYRNAPSKTNQTVGTGHE